MERIPKIYIATRKVTKFQRHRGLTTTTTTTTTTTIIIIIMTQGIWERLTALVFTNPGVQ